MRATNDPDAIHVLHIKGKLNGGAATISYQLANKMQGRVVFDWLLTEPFSNSKTELEMKRLFLELGGEIIEVPSCTSKLKRFLFFWRVFKERNVKIVHIDTDNLSRWKLAFIAMLAGVRCRVFHAHSTHSEQKNKRQPSRMQKKVLQWLIRSFSTDYFACSKAAGVYMFGEKGVLSPKFRIVKNGIESKEYQFSSEDRRLLRDQERVDASTIVLGFVGRFVKVKNIPFLLEVFEQYHHLHEDSVLWMVGDGELKDDVEKRIAEKALSEHIKLWGSRSDVLRLMQGMDALLLPSFFEGFPMVSIEAQAVGLPCFVSDHVPEEIRLTDLVHFLPITEGRSVWVDAIEKNTCGNNRKGQIDRIKDQGYELSETANSLMAFYERAVRA